MSVDAPPPPPPPPPPRDEPVADQVDRPIVEDATTTQDTANPSDQASSANASAVPLSAVPEIQPGQGADTADTHTPGASSPDTPVDEPVNRPIVEDGPAPTGTPETANPAEAPSNADEGAASLSAVPETPPGQDTDTSDTHTPDASNPDTAPDTDQSTARQYASHDEPDGSLTPMDKWEASEDRKMAGDIIAHRKQQDILRQQDNEQGAQEIEDFISKLPTTDAIKADPQGYLDSLGPDEVAPSAPDAQPETGDGPASDESMDRANAAALVAFQKDLDRARAKGDTTFERATLENMSRVEAGDAVRADPQGYLDNLEQHEDLTNPADRYRTTVDVTPVRGNESINTERVREHEVAEHVTAREVRLDPEISSAEQADWFVSVEHEPLYPDNPSIETIEQGRIGDCHLIAAMDAVINVDPDFLANAISDNGESVTVKLYKDGLEVQVEIAKSLPVDAAGGPLFGRSSDGSTAGGLVEKAYASEITDGRYVELNEGGLPHQALEALTGRPGESSTPAMGPDRLRDLVQNSNPVCAGSRSTTALDEIGALERNDLGVIEGHAYVVTAVDQDGTVHLHNPWGEFHVVSSWRQFTRQFDYVGWC